MMTRQSRRRSIITCPMCGHMEVRARTCDIEMKCRRCSYRFEAVIGPFAEPVCDQNEASSSKPDVPNASQAGPTKAKPHQP
jgi:transcription elongation factor Elf1